MKKLIVLLMLCGCLVGCRVENDVNYDSVGFDASEVDEEYDGAPPVPEPGTIVLLSVAVIGFLVYDGMHKKHLNASSFYHF